jgi:hypothetical protein
MPRHIRLRRCGRNVITMTEKKKGVIAIAAAVAGLWLLWGVAAIGIATTPEYTPGEGGGIKAAEKSIKAPVKVKPKEAAAALADTVPGAVANEDGSVTLEDGTVIPVEEVVAEATAATGGSSGRPSVTGGGGTATGGASGGNASTGNTGGKGGGAATGGSGSTGGGASSGDKGAATGGGGSTSGGSGSTGGSSGGNASTGNTGGGGGAHKPPEKVWHEPEYKTVHHPAEYEEVWHDAEYREVWVFHFHYDGYETTSVADKNAHQDQLALQELDGSYTTLPRYELVREGWTEQVLVREAWDEQVLVREGYWG